MYAAEASDPLSFRGLGGMLFEDLYLHGVGAWVPFGYIVTADDGFVLVLSNRDLCERVVDRRQ